MAINMNLRDLRNPQYTAATGRKSATPYTAYLTGMGPYVVAAKQQADQDALREKEFLQGTDQFNASQALERERLDAAEGQAGKSSMISGAGTLVTAASMANQAGLINLKDIAGGVGKLIWPGGTTGATTATTAADAAAAIAAGEAGGAGGTVVGSLAGGEAGATVTAEQAAAAAYAGEAGGAGGVAVGSGAGGATVSGIAAPALAYGVAGHYLMQEAGSLQKKAFGGNESNTGVKLGDVVGRASEGAIGPLVDTFWPDAPGAVRVATDLFNPAGFLARTFDRGCIIVTACTSADSEEVNIAREYRDKRLTQEQLRGYYMIAEKIVPLIHRFSIVKWFMKKILVDNLITYGRHALGKGPYPGPLATRITRGFLALCKAIGSRKPSFVRYNREIV